jgi:hypothetical protein
MSSIIAAHGNGDAPRGYHAIKALAKDLGCSLETLLAMAKKNDPFYCGAPAHVEKAQWFAALWRTFAYTTGVHLRRIHYQLVSQPDPRMHDGNAVPEYRALLGLPGRGE